MLVCVALGALFANGATGPLAALMTLILPPEIKSFGLSVFEFRVLPSGAHVQRCDGRGLAGKAAGLSEATMGRQMPPANHVRACT